MRKTTEILFILLVFGSHQAMAQQNYASISFGATLPQGDYAATGDLSSNGYARNGGAIKFDAGYFPVSYIGIGGSFSFGSNFVNRDSLINDVISYIETNTPGGIDIPDYAEITYGSGFWNYINLFIGPQFSIRATQRIYFDFRALGGLSIIRPPDQELAISYAGNNIYAHTSYNNIAFGFTAGGGIRIMLNTNLALRFSGDFVQTKARNTYSFDLFQGVTDNVPPSDAEFYIRAVELAAGLAYSF